MHTIWNLIPPYTGVLLLHYFVSQLIPSRFTFRKAALFYLPTALTHLPKLFLGSFSPIAQIISVAAATIVCTLYPLVLYSGPKWKRISFSVFFYALQMLMDTVCYGIVRPVLGDDIANYSVLQQIKYLVVAWSLYILVASFCVLLSRTISMRRLQLFHVLFLVFPISQITLVYCSIFHILNAFWVLGVLLGLGAEVALLGYTISQEKKTALEEELIQTRHTLELEQAHYEAMEERQEEMTQIRHDFNNQLATIGQLIRRGERDDAQHMIHQLADDINQTRDNFYCTIPVVNAILSEKAKVCEAAGIALTVDLDMPPEISMEPLHLCSIFSNLLDNAIHGAQNSGVESPSIQLTSIVDGDYLFIKTVNPARPPVAKPAIGHGYGHKILKDLAEQHHGDHHAEFANETYVSVVSLLVP